jgi:hypothetical protein
MNTFEFYRAFEKIKISDIQLMAVEAAQYAESQIVSDSIEANTNGGKTFMGRDIDEVKPFTDWFETGQFHQNLKFLESSNIEFISSGDGYDAIKAAFKESDWIAPHARTLDEETLDKLTKYFIDFFKQQIQINAK